MRICDRTGHPLRTLDLGDASKHVQTTPDGHIWVGYFDEGVYGDTESEELVCFDSNGTSIFNYAEFAEQHDLPFIDDCYTLNVVGAAVWVSYETAFLLVSLKDFKLERVWESVGANRAIAVRVIALSFFLPTTSFI